MTIKSSLRSVKVVAVLTAIYFLFGVHSAFASVIYDYDSHGVGSAIIYQNQSSAPNPAGSSFVLTSAASLSSIDVTLTGNCGGTCTGTTDLALYVGSTTPSGSVFVATSSTHIANSSITGTGVRSFSFSSLRLEAGLRYVFVVQSTVILPAAKALYVSYGVVTSPVSPLVTSFTTSSSGYAPAFLVNGTTDSGQLIHITAPTDGQQIDASFVDVSVEYNNLYDASTMNVCIYDPDAFALNTGGNPCENGGIGYSIGEAGTIDFRYNNIASSSQKIINVGFGPSYDYIAGGVRYVDFDTVSIGFYEAGAYPSSATSTPTQASIYAGLDCGGLNLVDNLKCAGLFLFYPTYTVAAWANMPDLASTTPFNYVYESRQIFDAVFAQSATTSYATLNLPISVTIGSVNASSTLTAGTLASVSTSGNNLFAYFRTYFGYALWMMLLFALYDLARHSMSLFVSVSSDISLASQGKPKGRGLTVNLNTPPTSRPHKPNPL